MGLINRAIEKRIMKLNDLDKLLEDQFVGYGESTAGTQVNNRTAFMSSAVYSCVRILSFSIAMLPLFVYEELDRGKRKAKQHKLYKLLHSQPNPEMTSFTYRSTSMAHITTWGNAYSEIEVNRNAEPVALWPIPPWKVEVYRNQKRQIFYQVRLNNGEKKNIPSYRMIHIMGLTTDGMKGMSVLGAAREAIGLGLAAEEYGARFFGSGTNVGGLVRHPGKLKTETFDKVKESLNEKYQGLGKSHRLMFLDEGMEYEKVGIPPEDAQFLQTRKFQLTDIARFYNVPLHLLQEHENATTWGSGLEELNTGFVIYSLNPYLVNWEQETNRKLLDNEKYFVEHSVEGLLRGDTEARSNFYNKLFQMAAISPNEIREYENKNPYDGGDEYYIQLNMIPVSQALTKEEEIELQNARSVEEREQKLIELRHKRAAESRHRIAKSYENVFKQASARVVNREKADIMRKAEKIFSSENKKTRGNPSELLSFEEFLDEFYGAHPEYMRKQIMPSINSIAEAINAEAALEIKAKEGLTDELIQFINEYHDAYVARYIGSSKGQLKKVARTAIENDEDVIDALDTRLEEWKERRPAKEALNETVKLSNAIAKATFAAAGIRYLRWYAIGADTCPYCEEMDGKIVGIDQMFLTKDSKLNSEEKGDMTIYKPIGHPPLHQGCVCQVMPE